VIQKSPADLPKGFRRPDLGLSLRPGRILPKPDLGVEVFSRLAGLADIECGDGAQCHAALSGSELKLENVAAIAARTQAEAEAGDIVIPFDVIRLARR